MNERSKMKRYSLIWMVLMVIVSAYGQNERKVIRDGVRAYEDGAFEDAELQFRKAVDINRKSFEAEFNTGVALYGQEKYEETVKQYQALLEKSDDPETMAHIWHNIGNSLLEEQQYAPSIEAYKNSLRKNPADEDTRYNLAYAKQKLKEQQEQEQEKQDNQDNKDQQDQEKNKDQKDNQDNKNQQDQEKNKDQQDQQDQKNKQDQEKNQDQQQPQPNEISKDDAERMLKAIQQQ
jgi:Ca-activated chloride channel family protein